MTILSMRSGDKKIRCNRPHDVGLHLEGMARHSTYESDVGVLVLQARATSWSTCIQVKVQGLSSVAPHAVSRQTLE